MAQNIRFSHADTAWSTVDEHIKRLLLQARARRVLEVGAGANPLFDLDFVRRHGLEYTLLDISADELAKAPDGYVKLAADITSPTLQVGGGRYDFVFSRMLAEHVRDGQQFHRNVFSLLAPGGHAFHFFPTLYSVPFVVNRIVPERFAEWLLSKLQRGREKAGHHAKFPAYYSWCRGPTQRQLGRFQALGYHVDEYVGFFGNAGYYTKMPPLMRANRAMAAWLERHPVPMLTSFAFLTLSRPIP